MGDAAQVLLWGFLASHASHFIGGPSWPRFSAPIRFIVVAVLGLNTLHTATCISDLWAYGNFT